ncbi:major facilitator superfamily domain-containing protein [Leucosporidium creatinivorum]|uniref:Major facilitator superfamily domain-containing protein n=1 Tax=Leucosporidium creatinivorum TaxID=106004 RepID=A0A1Y2D5N8_9BASI|nr:major facilitator superfamily domain-containing protein [Leucosporidium creatinivorum]
MPLGVLQVQGHVPGTAFLDDSKQAHVDETLAAAGQQLKKGTGRHKDTVLVPQPSDDLNDPLNWPRWKKELFFANLVAGGALTGAIGHLINAGFKVIASQWGVSVDAVSSTNAWLNLATAVYTIVQGALATKIGRRPIFVSASLMQVVATIWSARSNGYNSFLGSRVISGLGMAPYQGLAGAAIGDVFFAHERGLRVAIWSFAIGGAINITPMINGTFLDKPDGWRTCFYIIFGIFCAHLCTVLVSFPESAYHRAAIYETDQGASATQLAAARLAEKLERADEPLEKADNGQFVERASRESLAIGETSVKKTWVQELAIWSYTGKDSLPQLLVRPFRSLLNPIVWYAIFAYGFIVTFLVVISVVNATIFSLAPYKFNARLVGFTSAGPLVGSILGTVVAGPLVDYLTKWFARRNGGIYEPESRLIANVFALVFMAGGLGAWAGSTPYHPHWAVPVILYGVINFGQCIAAAAVATYLLDATKHNSAESFAVINFAKDIMLWAMSRHFNSWILEHGVQTMFGIVSGICAFCIVLSVPMYIFGKKTRAWIAENPLLFKTN